MRIFLTGGTGFIGHHLIKRLLLDKYEIIALKKKEKPIPKIFQNQKIKWVDGELGCSKLINIPECDVLIHLAASGVKSNNRNWDQCLATNIFGIKELLDSIDNLKFKPIIFYPLTFYETIEYKSNYMDDNPYIVTKRVSTKIIDSWVNNTNASKIIYGVIYQIYGLNDSNVDVLSYIKNQLNRNLPAKLGSKNNQRDWLYIDDLIQGIIESFSIQTKGIQRYDFGSGKLCTLEKISKKLAKTMGKPESLLHFNSVPDLYDTKIKEYAKDFVPGWAPKYSIDRGILEFAGKNY